jgi:meso-butanediol dehydrogenase / (S,S)-butanediol dehydrogenase / diacetyl reductase
VAGRLEGKVVLITGTSGGMGRDAAILFAKEGAKVVGSGYQRCAEAEETARMARAAGGDMVSYQPVDLAVEQQAKAWVDFAVKTYGGVDVVYNNASYPRMGTVEETTEEDWRYTLKNELDIVYFVCKAAWPHLKAKGGSVITVGSIAGMTALPAELPSAFAHAATKGGVIGMTRQLAIDGAPLGIRVNCISPGFILTAGTPFAQDESLQAPILPKIPMKRFGQPEEVAKVALFFASDDSSYVTGVNVAIDGGVTAW